MTATVPARALGWAEITEGSARYTTDIVPPAPWLDAVVVRAEVPYGTIRDIDVTAAERVPGVHAVLTAEHFSTDARYIHLGGPRSDWPPLARGVVRYVGEAVAVVAAETPDAARRARDLVRVRYRRGRAPLTMADAVAGKGVSLHERPTGEKNVSLSVSGQWGRQDADAEDAAVPFSAVYRYPRVAHACMEPHAVVASWNPERELLELWVSTQAPYFVAKEVAAILGLSTDQVICREVAVGGGFGVKSKIAEHEVLAAALSMMTRRPVRLVLDRSEEFGATKTRHEARVDLTLRATRGGKMTSIDGNVWLNNGAYNHSGPAVLASALRTLGYAYRLDHVAWRGKLIDTASQPGGPFRGFGRPQVNFALESQVDEAARGLGLDPVEFRLANAVGANCTGITGSKIGTNALTRCLEVARREIGWDEKRRNRRPFRGLGIAVAMHGSGAYTMHDANRSEAAIEVQPGGRVVVYFGGADAGTGQRTILAGIAASVLGVDASTVDVVMMDGEKTPFDMGAWASRGTHMGGHAVRVAAEALRAHLEELADQDAGERSGAVREGVDPDPTRPRFEVPLDVLAAKSPLAVDGVLRITGQYVDPYMEWSGSSDVPANKSASYSFAAHAVELEVDPDTGLIRILDYVAVHDSGNVLHPTLARGQVEGGVVMGLGAALREELLYEGGRPINTSYLYYPLLRNRDAPSIRVYFVGEAEPRGPFGAKSLGEIPVVPVAPAVANAVYDATGIRFHELPLTPDKIIQGLQEQRGERKRRYGIWRRPGRWWIAGVRSAYGLGLHAALHRWGPSRPVREAAHGDVPEVLTPETVAEAVATLSAESRPMGGGTDLRPRIRRGLMRARRIVMLDRIERFRDISVAPDGAVSIGASVTLDELSRHPLLHDTVLGQAVATIASPQIRTAATVAGNLLQANRCWFLNNGFNCYKRGGPGRPCYAVLGDHRFHHAIIGGHRCQAVTPSDLATALTALDAYVTVDGRRGQRSVHVGDLYVGPGETRLDASDLVTAIVVPSGALRRHQRFEKLALTAGDFAVASVAVAFERGPNGEWLDGRIVAGGVAPIPWQARRTSRRLRGHVPVPDLVCSLFESELTANAHPLRRNEWKLDALLGLARKAAHGLADPVPSPDGGREH